METKGITCKIPLELHNQISEEIRETESTMSKFIEMVIREHYEKGANKVMEKGRTLAFQVSEELFQKVKEYLDLYEKTYHRRLTPKECQRLQGWTDSFPSFIFRRIACTWWLTSFCASP